MPFTDDTIMTEAWSEVRGLVPVSLCDWPGRVTAVLFVGGCPWRCPTCHNAELAWYPERLPALHRQAVLAELTRRRQWLDGVVVSGGEPTAWPGLELLVREIVALGLPVKLDTNASAPQVVERLVTEELVAAVAVDVKGPWRSYPRLTGGAVDPATAEANFRRILALAQKNPQRFLFRCTKVPALSPQDLLEVRRYVPETFPFYWQEYIPPRPIAHGEETTHAFANSQT